MAPTERPRTEEMYDQLLPLPTSIWASIRGCLSQRDSAEPQSYIQRYLAFVALSAKSAGWLVGWLVCLPRLCSYRYKCLRNNITARHCEKRWMTSSSALLASLGVALPSSIGLYIHIYYCTESLCWCITQRQTVSIINKMTIAIDHLAFDRELLRCIGKIQTICANVLWHTGLRTLKLGSTETFIFSKTRQDIFFEIFTKFSKPK